VAGYLVYLEAPDPRVQGSVTGPQSCTGLTLHRIERLPGHRHRWPRDGRIRPPR
jgi:hypothetical protein